MAWWAGIFPLLSIAGLIGIFVAARRTRAGAAFVGSTVFFAGLLGSAAASMFPYLVPSFPRGGGISAAGAMPTDARVVIFAVAAIGLIAVVGYSIVVTRRMHARAPSE